MDKTVVEASQGEVQCEIANLIKDNIKSCLLP